MSVMRVVVLHPCTKFEVRRSPRSEGYGAFSVSALIRLVTLTFDLSTSKWGLGLRVSWASFLSIFSLLRLYILYLWSGTYRQTDGQTDDGHQRLMPPPYVGVGIKTIELQDHVEAPCSGGNFWIQRSKVKIMRPDFV